MHLSFEKNLFAPLGVGDFFGRFLVLIVPAFLAPV